MSQLFTAALTGVAYRPPLANGLPPIWGTPESFLDGPPGYQVMDVATGTIYVKGSAEGTLTGWTTVTTS